MVRSNYFSICLTLLETSRFIIASKRFAPGSISSCLQNPYFEKIYCSKSKSYSSSSISFKISIADLPFHTILGITCSSLKCWGSVGITMLKSDVVSLNSKAQSESEFCRTW